MEDIIDTGGLQPFPLRAGFTIVVLTPDEYHKQDQSWRELKSEARGILWGNEDIQAAVSTLKLCRVLTAARVFSLLSPLGKNVGLLMWGSAEKQRIPDSCKDFLPSS